jgi:hypothetical protein
MPGPGRLELAVDPGTAHAFNGSADAEDPGVSGPAVDATAVIADLHPPGSVIDCGDQVQVHRSRHPGQDDIAGLHPGRVNRGDTHQLPTAEFAVPSHSPRHGGETRVQASPR